MSFQAALAQLALLDVEGVRHNYGIGTIPDSFQRASLPALLVLPIETENEGLFRRPSEGFRAVAFADGLRTASFTLTHQLLVAPAEGRLRDHLPTLVSLMDAYFSALSANLTLGDSLLEAPQVRVEAGITQIGGMAFYGCAFRHTWLLEVS